MRNVLLLTPWTGTWRHKYQGVLYKDSDEFYLTHINITVRSIFAARCLWIQLFSNKRALNIPFTIERQDEFNNALDNISSWTDLYYRAQDDYEKSQNSLLTSHRRVYLIWQHWERSGVLALLTYLFYRISIYRTQMPKII